MADEPIQAAGAPGGGVPRRRTPEEVARELKEQILEEVDARIDAKVGAVLSGHVEIMRTLGEQNRVMGAISTQISAHHEWIEKQQEIDKEEARILAEQAQEAKMLEAEARGAQRILDKQAAETKDTNDAKQQRKRDGRSRLNGAEVGVIVGFILSAVTVATTNSDHSAQLGHPLSIATGLILFAILIAVAVYFVG